MPSAKSDKPIKKLVLCFDGTGNTFSGTPGDTNIVKLYDKFDRDDPHQFHYYQTGIGTYDVNGGSVNKTFLGSIRSTFTRTLDEGFGTSFDHHVMAGYKFLMNHYDAGIKSKRDPSMHLDGDKIYLFGFSRGAFTARFLARMINAVGLLSMGNDEMVRFAYQLYQQYEKGKFRPVNSKKGPSRVDTMIIDTVKAGVTTVRERWLENDWSTSDMSTSSAEANPTVTSNATGRLLEPADDKTQEIEDQLMAFKNTFGRDVKVYFLGIFDCVNSVAVLGNPKEPAPVFGTATHVRHAVAVDEFRVKFKPALLQQDVSAYTNSTESIKEVWFPGNHGDVGGGWPILDEPKSFWDRLSRGWSTDKPLHFGTSADPSTDKFQMSDIPLDWMIHELELVNAENPKWAVSFSQRKDGFKNALRTKEKLKQAKESAMHDTLKFGGGCGPLKVILWNIMEYLPFISRYELDKYGKWIKCTFHPNKGSARDIPKGAVLHQSLLDRISNAALHYRPRNNQGDGTKPCLLNSEGTGVAQFTPIPGSEEEDAVDAQGQAINLHRTYTFGP